MSKVITFSRSFPSYHPRKGEPTFFVEKFWQSIYIDVYCDCVRDEFDFSLLYNAGVDIYANDKYTPKHHTIRAGHRWKVGDKFSPRIWSGKPYASKQITIAPDIEIKKIWRYDVYEGLFVFLDGKDLTNEIGASVHDQIISNDGLTESDFVEWFRPAVSKGDFKGQIICWNESINY